MHYSNTDSSPSSFLNITFLFCAGCQIHFLSPLFIFLFSSIIQVRWKQAMGNGALSVEILITELYCHSAFGEEVCLEIIDALSICSFWGQLFPTTFHGMMNEHINKQINWSIRSVRRITPYIQYSMWLPVLYSSHYDLICTIYTDGHKVDAITSCWQTPSLWKRLPGTSDPRRGEGDCCKLTVYLRFLWTPDTW